MSKKYQIEIYRGVVIVDLNFKKIYYLINFGKKKMLFLFKIYFNFNQILCFVVVYIFILNVFL